MTTEPTTLIRPHTKLPYSSIAVANQFVQLGIDNGRPVTPMALQKLSYFAHGWRLKIAGLPLVDEEFQAWKLGPVMSDVYHEFKRFRADPVLELGSALEPNFDRGEIVSFVVTKPRIDVSDTGIHALLRATWKHYGQYDPLALSKMTHDEGGAWYRVWKNSAVRNGMRAVGIPNSKIRDEFDLRADAYPNLCQEFRDAIKS